MCKNIICAVDVDKKILLFVIFGLNYIDIVFGSVRELYHLLLFDIVSFPICIFVFVWSEKRPQNTVWSVLVTKKSTFAQACLKVTILDHIGGKPWNLFKFSGVLSEKNIFFWKDFSPKPVSVDVCKKKILKFHTFKGGDQDQKCEIFFFQVRTSLITQKRDKCVM